VPHISIQAFCERPETAQALDAVFQDRHLYRAHSKLHMGGLQAAVEFYAEAPTPNLIILECLVSSKDMVGALEHLAEFCDPGTKVIVIGGYNDVLLYRELKRRGVTEYIVAPFDDRVVVQTISEAFSEKSVAEFGRLCAFIGARGGVGSSTLAQNVAFNLASDYQQNVVLADMDLGYGTAGLNLNQDPVHGIAEAVFTADRVDDTMIERLLCQCTEHLSLLAAPALLDREYDFDKGAFDGVLDILRTNVPYSVLDLPHTWNGWTKQILTAADELVITATPDLASLRNTKNLLETLKSIRKNDHAPHIVLNQVGLAKRPEISPMDFADSLEQELAAVIPFDAVLFGTSANNGQMLVEASANAKPTEIIRNLGIVLSGRAAARADKKSPLAGITKQLERFRRK
jgi:pilus assembly protein CpaE